MLVSNVYPYWRRRIIFIHIGKDRIFIFILATTECFAFILVMIMIQMYLEVVTSVLTWYHMLLEESRTLHTFEYLVIRVIIEYVTW